MSAHDPKRTQSIRGRMALEGQYVPSGASWVSAFREHQGNITLRGAIAGEWTRVRMLSSCAVDRMPSNRYVLPCLSGMNHCNGTTDNATRLIIEPLACERRDCASACDVPAAVLFRDPALDDIRHR